MEKNINYTIEKILQLCKIPSPSGFTRDCEKYLLQELEKLGYNPRQSVKGNVIADLGGESRPLVLASHIDTLGAMVRSIKSNGRIRYTKVGGFPDNYIESENCLVHTRDNKVLTGTVRLNNPSVHTDSYDSKREESLLEIVLDEKVKTKKEVEDLGVSVGDYISFDPRTVFTEKGFIKSRHLDDKASAGILLGLARMMADEKMKLNRKVFLVFTNFEEVGHGASSALPEVIEELLVVDMGVIGDDLSCDEYKVSICAKDSQGPYDYEVTSALIDTAKKHKINHAVDIYPRYGSDASAALSAGYDIKYGLVGPGVYASHGYERTHKEAIANTLMLLKHYVTI